MERVNCRPVSTLAGWLTIPLLAASAACSGPSSDDADAQRYAQANEQLLLELPPLGEVRAGTRKFERYGDDRDPGFQTLRVFTQTSRADIADIRQAIRNHLESRRWVCEDLVVSTAPGQDRPALHCRKAAATLSANVHRSGEAVDVEVLADHREHLNDADD